MLHPALNEANEICLAYTNTFDRGYSQTHLLHAVNTEGDAGTGPETNEAETEADDPGHGTGLLVSPGGDAGLTVGTHHLHWSVSEPGSLDILDLGHHCGSTSWSRGHGRGWSVTTLLCW